MKFISKIKQNYLQNYYTFAYILILNQSVYYDSSVIVS